jgi:hypothetical protein
VGARKERKTGGPKGEEDGKVRKSRETVKWGRERRRDKEIDRDGGMGPEKRWGMGVERERERGKGDGRRRGLSVPWCASFMERENAGV